ncbi:tRNA (adenosine(37)-N6)-dimethylallyltransferase MiaA [Bacteroidota bacterium]
MAKQVDIITILGHTAAGKTSIAAHAAVKLEAEVISADSRQVYRGMTIGTGKDYTDYIVEDSKVPYHIVDIVDAGDEYNVYEFQKDFQKVYEDLKKRSILPVLCGGTGLYLESVLRQFDLLSVPVNMALRNELEKKSLTEIVDILQSYKSLHNSTDTETRKRAVRAVEIAEYTHRMGDHRPAIPKINSLTFGIYYDRDERRARITSRLKQRLEEGMITEAETLISSGVSHEKLEYYGLEYKFLSRYLQGNISYDEMFSQLNTAIHRFAKRQMTYFRGMEKRGLDITWIKGDIGTEEIVATISQQYSAS